MSMENLLSLLNVLSIKCPIYEMSFFEMSFSVISQRYIKAVTFSNLKFYQFLQSVSINLMV